MSDVTRILCAIEAGDSSAADELLPHVYEELRKLAAQRLAQETPGQTLQATALVHEAYLRLVDAEKAQDWKSRGHFFAAAAEAMRRILIDNARRKKRVKHGGEMRQVELADDQLADPAAAGSRSCWLSMRRCDRLAEIDEPAAHLVKLHYFGGLTLEQAGEFLGYSVRTAHRNWAFARAWLYQQLGGERP